jgi:hypothetical protein
MKYTQEMILHSDSGYCMPFEEKEQGCGDVSGIWEAETS